MTQRQRMTLIFTTFFVQLVADQATKQWAIAAVKPYPARSYFGDFFRLQYAENAGAFLSLGSTLSDTARFWLLTVMVAGILAFTIYYLFRTAGLTRVQVICLAAAVSGGFSNWIDRVFRTEGRVVDFLNVGIGSLRTGIFNIADMAILFGIGVFLFLNKPEQGSSPDPVDKR